MPHYRSLLFVPGNRPDRFEKACRAGADLVCIDLEDAVAPQDKSSARTAAINWLKQTDHTHVSLRTNGSLGADNSFYDADIKALASSGLTNLPFIMLPKADSLDDITDMDVRLPPAMGPLFPIIESARGLVACEAILAHQRVGFSLYGAIDLGADTGMDQSWESHLYGRSRLSIAASAAQVHLFDVPSLEIRDPSVCEAETRRAKTLGIYAKAAIHPAQIPAIHAALRPSEAELTGARRIIAAFDASDGSVAQLDGRMLEAPVVKSARRVVALADETPG